MVTASRLVLTAGEIASRIGKSPIADEGLLRELKADGMAEEWQPGSWRITEKADAAHGKHLRGLTFD